MSKFVMITGIFILFAACSANNIRYYTDERSGSKFTVFDIGIQSRERQPGLLAGPYGGKAVFQREQKFRGEEKITMILHVFPEDYHGDITEKAAMVVDGMSISVLLTGIEHNRHRETSTNYFTTPGGPYKKAETYEYTSHSLMSILEINPDYKQALLGLNTLSFRITVGSRPVTYDFKPADIDLIKKFLTLDGKDFVKLRSGCL